MDFLLGAGVRSKSDHVWTRRQSLWEDDKEGTARCWLRLRCPPHGPVLGRCLGGLPLMLSRKAILFSANWSIRSRGMVCLIVLLLPRTVCELPACPRC